MKIYKNKPSNKWKGNHFIYINKTTLLKKTYYEIGKKTKIYRNKPSNIWKGKHFIFL